MIWDPTNKIDTVGAAPSDRPGIGSSPNVRTLRGTIHRTRIQSRAKTLTRLEYDRKIVQEKPGTSPPNPTQRQQNNTHLKRALHAIHGHRAALESVFSLQSERWWSLPQPLFVSPNLFGISIWANYNNSLT